MSTPGRSPEEKKDLLALRPETFAPVRAEIERMLTEMHALGVGLKQNFEQSFSAVADAIEGQLKEAIRAPGQMGRKQGQLELRPKQGKEIELAKPDTQRTGHRLS